VKLQISIKHLFALPNNASILTVVPKDLDLVWHTFHNISQVEIQGNEGENV
jgi:hypothetical protein